MPKRVQSVLRVCGIGRDAGGELHRPKAARVNVDVVFDGEPDLKHGAPALSIERSRYQAAALISTPHVNSGTLYVAAHSIQNENLASNSSIDLSSGYISVCLICDFIIECTPLEASGRQIDQQIRRWRSV
jgi:hypothetical protein